MKMFAKPTCLTGISLVVMSLSSVNCGATRSSDLSQRVEPAEARLAGRPISKWHKAEEIRFPSAIFQDGSSRYWVGNGIGVHVYDEKRDVWADIPREALGWQVADIKQIAESDDRGLWIRSTPVLADNLRFFDREHWRALSQFSKSRVSVMFTGASGKLWFGAGDELVAYQGKSWSPRLILSGLIRPPEQSYFNISAGLEDRSGLVWLATQGRTISLDPTTKGVKNRFEQEGLAHVQCICEDDTGKIWFGSSDRFVSVYNKVSDSVRTYDLLKYLPSSQLASGEPGLPRIMVNAILQDNSGQIMIATTRGLMTVDRPGDNWQAFTPENSPIPPGGVTAIMQGRDGRIWIGTGEGILVLSAQ